MVNITSLIPYYDPITLSSRPDLERELLQNIEEELHIRIPPITPRHVCGPCGGIPTPSSTYETVEISQETVNPNAVDGFASCLQMIRSHTRHIILGSGLSRQHVVDFLNTISRLEAITYLCRPLPTWTGTALELDFMSDYGPIGSGSGPYTEFWIPEYITCLTNRNPNDIRIHIEDLPAGALDGNSGVGYIQAIPIPLLVTLSTGVQTKDMPDHTTVLKSLLLTAPALEVFRFRDLARRGTRFEFLPGERLPPFRELTLQGYSWDHGVHEAAAHWDFSRIRSLQLVGMPVLRFLVSALVIFSDFRFLRSLRIDDGGVDDDYPENRRNATVLADVLVRNYIWALVELDIVCCVDDFGADALYAQGATLRSLVIRDHESVMGGGGDDDDAYPTIDPVELRGLSERMEVLETIELDMDARDLPRASEFLDAVVEFPRLSRLTLHVRTAGGKVVPRQQQDGFPSGGGMSADVRYVRTVLEFLVQSKPRHTVPWRRITIMIDDDGGRGGRMEERSLEEMWRGFGLDCWVRRKRCFVAVRARDTGEWVVGDQGYLERRGRCGILLP